MKKTITAAFALSLLAGTSAFAQQAPRGDRTDDGDRRARVAEHRQSDDGQQADRQSRRDEDRPVRPVPPVSNERAQAVIAAARTRQAAREAIVSERRNDRANDAIAEARARQTDRRETVTQTIRERVEHRSQPQRVQIVPHVAPRTDDRRTDRRSGDDSRRVELRDRDRSGDHRDGDRSRYERYHRPGEGHQLRDRDHGRHWYNPDQWRRSYRATHRYRVPYHRPSGWYVRSWIFGDYLPHGWYTQSHYLDWWRYRLPMPPIGTEWVRVGDDALLVDTWSGEVLSIYQDLFW